MAKRPRLEVPETRGTFLGIDIGKKKWGLSTSDTAKRIAFPLSILLVTEDMVETLHPVIQQHRTEKIIIGIPHHISGEENTYATHIRAIGNILEEHLRIPVVYHDERLTTAIAQGHLAELEQYPTKNDDHFAAQVLLQRYLDEIHNT